jgi:TRAP-type uncharacterized transport system substrate-binding protein
VRNTWLEKELVAALETRNVIPVLLDEKAKDNRIWPLIADRNAIDLKKAGSLNAVAQEVAQAVQRNQKLVADRQRPTTAIRRWIALTVVPAVLLTVAASAWWHFVQLPPHTIIMATGDRNLAYYNFGKSYAEALRREGIDVEIQATRGSVDNLSRLHDPDPKKRASVALIQGGTINATNASDLESLGTIFYEPLWLFEKRGITGDGIGGLRSKTVAVGPDGSDTQRLALELLNRHGIDEQVSKLLPLTTAKGIEQLQSGEIDAAFIVSSWNTPDVQMLLNDERVELRGYPEADAYADLYPYLHKVVLHRGVIDLANRLPPHDVPLIAARASLIVRKDLHPAIQFLLLNAAKQIHAKQNILQEANEFPSAEAANLPLSAAAQQFYKPGLSYFVSNFLKNYLPFWVAEPINDVLIPVLILVVTLGILTPFFRPVPALFNWMMQRPIFRLFVAMMALEAELDSPAGKKNAGRIAVELDHLERQANRLVLRVPVSYAGMLLILRQRIDALRERLDRYTAERGPG